MPYCFLLNPAAANGRAKRLRGRLEATAQAAGMAYVVRETQAAGHATDLAREAAAEGYHVVAVGGDGTVQEAAAGVLGTEAALGVVPAGTGNDYARSLGLPTKLDAAARLLPFLSPRATDIGRVSWTNADGSEHASLFTNALGTGFDAYAASLAEHYKRLPGQAAYLAAIFKGLRTWSNPPVRIGISEAAPAIPAGHEAEPSLTSWFEGPFFLLSLGVGFSVGGGFRLTPDALPDDGLLDACLLRGITAGRAIQLLPRAMRGAHIGADEVTLTRLTSMTLDSDTPLPVHADGELLSTSAVRLTATIEPDALRVLRPDA
ncbi:MAG: diacylglycerol kinase family protein [Bacteroidota bacterium]